MIPFLDKLIMALLLLVCVADFQMNLFFGLKQIMIIPALLVLFTVWSMTKRLVRFIWSIAKLSPLLLAVCLLFHFNILCWKGKTGVALC